MHDALRTQQRLDTTRNTSLAHEDGQYWSHPPPCPDFGHYHWLIPDAHSLILIVTGFAQAHLHHPPHGRSAARRGLRDRTVPEAQPSRGATSSRDVQLPLLWNRRMRATSQPAADVLRGERTPLASGKKPNSTAAVPSNQRL